MLGAIFEDNLRKAIEGVEPVPHGRMRPFVGGDDDGIVRASLDREVSGIDGYIGETVENSGYVPLDWGAHFGMSV